MISKYTPWKRFEIAKRLQRIFFESVVMDIFKFYTHKCSKQIESFKEFFQECIQDDSLIIFALRKSFEQTSKKCFNFWTSNKAKKPWKSSKTGLFKKKFEIIDSLSRNV